MQKLYSAALAATFGTASAIAILMSAAQNPTAAANQTLLTAWAQPAIAKEHERGQSDDNKSHGCVNPAGNVRGWCKHNGGFYAYRNISGRVLSVSGYYVRFVRNNGQVLTLYDQFFANRGIVLYPGQYYNLRGYYSNGVFVPTAIM